MAFDANSTAASGGAVIRFPRKAPPYDRAKRRYLKEGDRLPANVCRLREPPPPRERVMPSQTPELAILTAIMVSDPALARRVENALFPLRHGCRGEAGEKAFNYMNRLVMGTD